ncbi:Hypothetical predicted protein, partial [Pelobates cultripes]
MGLAPKARLQPRTNDLTPVLDTALAGPLYLTWMPGRKSSKTSQRETISVAEMLTTKRHAACGAQADQTTKQLEVDEPALLKGNPPDTSNATILQSLTEVKGFLAAEIARTVVEVKAKIAAIGTHTTVVEQRVARLVSAHNSSATLSKTLRHRITDLEIELEDISNRARRNNLRIRGLPETVSDAELETALVNCFRQGLPDIPEHLWMIDKAHRALWAKGPNNSPPKDVIIKWHYYLRCSRLQPYKWKGTELQLYQDITLATLQRRRDWKLITDLLREKGIRFAWGYPFKIIVFNGPKPSILLPSMDIQAFLSGLDYSYLLTTKRDWLYCQRPGMDDTPEQPESISGDLRRWSGRETGPH